MLIERSELDGKYAPHVMQLVFVYYIISNFIEVHLLGHGADGDGHRPHRY
jgi:hypothetical protein